MQNNLSIPEAAFNIAASSAGGEDGSEGSNTLRRTLHSHQEGHTAAADVYHNGSHAEGAANVNKNVKKAKKGANRGRRKVKLNANVVGRSGEAGGSSERLVNPLHSDARRADAFPSDEGEDEDDEDNDEGRRGQWEGRPIRIQATPLLRRHHTDSVENNSFSAAGQQQPQQQQHLPSDTRQMENKTTKVNPLRKKPLAAEDSVTNNGTTAVYLLLKPSELHIAAPLERLHGQSLKLLEARLFGGGGEGGAVVDADPSLAAVHVSLIIHYMSSVLLNSALVHIEDPAIRVAMAEVVDRWRSDPNSIATHEAIALLSKVMAMGKQSALATRLKDGDAKKNATTSSSASSSSSSGDEDVSLKEKRRQRQRIAEEDSPRIAPTIFFPLWQYMISNKKGFERILIYISVWCVTSILAFSPVIAPATLTSHTGAVITLTLFSSLVSLVLVALLLILNHHIVHGIPSELFRQLLFYGSISGVLGSEDVGDEVASNVLHQHHRNVRHSERRRRRKVRDKHLRTLEGKRRRMASSTLHKGGNPSGEPTPPPNPLIAPPSTTAADEGGEEMRRVVDRNHHPSDALPFNRPLAMPPSMLTRDGGGLLTLSNADGRDHVGQVNDPVAEGEGEMTEGGSFYSSFSWRSAHTPLTDDDGKDSSEEKTSYDSSDLEAGGYFGGPMQQALAALGGENYLTGYYLANGRGGFDTVDDDVAMRRQQLFGNRATGIDGTQHHGQTETNATLMQSRVRELLQLRGRGDALLMGGGRRTQQRLRIAALFANHGIGPASLPRPTLAQNPNSATLALPPPNLCAPSIYLAHDMVAHSPIALHCDITAFAKFAATIIVKCPAATAVMASEQGRREALPASDQKTSAAALQQQQEEEDHQEGLGISDDDDPFITPEYRQQISKQVRNTISSASASKTRSLRHVNGLSGRGTSETAKSSSAADVSMGGGSPPHPSFPPVSEGVIVSVNERFLSLLNSPNINPMQIVNPSLGDAAGGIPSLASPRTLEAGVTPTFLPITLRGSHLVGKTLSSVFNLPAGPISRTHSQWSPIEMRMHNTNIVVHAHKVWGQRVAGMAAEGGDAHGAFVPNANVRQQERQQKRELEALLNPRLGPPNASASSSVTMNNLSVRDSEGYAVFVIVGVSTVPLAAAPPYHPMLSPINHHGSSMSRLLPHTPRHGHVHSSRLGSSHTNLLHPNQRGGYHPHSSGKGLNNVSASSLSAQATAADHGSAVDKLGKQMAPGDGGSVAGGSTAQAVAAGEGGGSTQISDRITLPASAAQPSLPPLPPPSSSTNDCVAGALAALNLLLQSASQEKAVEGEDGGNDEVVPAKDEAGTPRKKKRAKIKAISPNPNNAFIEQLEKIKASLLSATQPGSAAEGSHVGHPHGAAEQKALPPAPARNPLVEYEEATSVSIEGIVAMLMDVHGVMDVFKSASAPLRVSGLDMPRLEALMDRVVTLHDIANVRVDRDESEANAILITVEYHRPMNATRLERKAHDYLPSLGATLVQQSGLAFFTIPCACLFPAASPSPPHHRMSQRAGSINTIVSAFAGHTNASSQPMPALPPSANTTPTGGEGGGAQRTAEEAPASEAAPPAAPSQNDLAAKFGFANFSKALPLCLPTLLTANDDETNADDDFALMGTGGGDGFGMPPPLTFPLANADTVPTPPPPAAAGCEGYDSAAINIGASTQDPPLLPPTFNALEGSVAMTLNESFAMLNTSARLARIAGDQSGPWNGGGAAAASSQPMPTGSRDVRLHIVIFSPALTLATGNKAAGGEVGGAAAPPAYYQPFVKRISKVLHSLGQSVVVVTTVPALMKCLGFNNTIPSSSAHPLNHEERSTHLNASGDGTNNIDLLIVDCASIVLKAPHSTCGVRSNSDLVGESSSVVASQPLPMSAAKRTSLLLNKQTKTPKRKREKEKAPSQGSLKSGGGGDADDVLSDLGFSSDGDDDNAADAVAGADDWSLPSPQSGSIASEEGDEAEGALKNPSAVASTPAEAAPLQQSISPNPQHSSPPPAPQAVASVIQSPITENVVKLILAAMHKSLGGGMCVFCSSSGPPPPNAAAVSAGGDNVAMPLSLASLPLQQNNVPTLFPQNVPMSMRTASIKQMVSSVSIETLLNKANLQRLARLSLLSIAASAKANHQPAESDHNNIARSDAVTNAPYERPQELAALTAATSKPPTSSFSPAMAVPASLHMPTTGVANSMVMDYQLGRRLGGGGFGDVFEATLAVTGGKVALKRIYLKGTLAEYLSMHGGAGGGLSSETQLANITREVEIMASLNHPNIVKFIAVSQEGPDMEWLCIFMELCDGADLSKRLASGSKHPIAPNEVSKIIKDIAMAVGYMHANGVIHRDIKPQNILFRDGVAKLADFGTATRCHVTSASPSPLPASVTAAGADVPPPSQQHVSSSGGGGGARAMQQGTMRGTLAYMSPEVMLGERFNSSCDVWSLGCVLAEVLGIELPHVKSLGVAMLTLMYSEMREEDHILVPDEYDLPEEVSNLIERCLHRDWQQRPTAEEILAHPLVTDPSLAHSVRLQVLSRRKYVAEKSIDMSLQSAGDRQGGGDRDSLSGSMHSMVPSLCSTRQTKTVKRKAHTAAKPLSTSSGGSVHHLAMQPATGIVYFSGGVPLQTPQHFVATPSAAYEQQLMYQLQQQQLAMGGGARSQLDSSVNSYGGGNSQFNGPSSYNPTAPPRTMATPMPQVYSPPVMDALNPLLSAQRAAMLAMQSHQLYQIMQQQQQQQQMLMQQQQLGYPPATVGEVGGMIGHMTTSSPYGAVPTSQGAQNMALPMAGGGSVVSAGPFGDRANTPTVTNTTTTTDGNSFFNGPPPPTRP